MENTAAVAEAPPVVLSPCAACKILRRRCTIETCVLAPYFPPTDPLKFTIAHRVFGASNIIKLLQVHPILSPDEKSKFLCDDMWILCAMICEYYIQELPEPQRADAVSSMVYEAKARLRDPVYGCAGAISQLQKQINELQAELALAQAEILNFQCQNANLYELICKHDDRKKMATLENHDDQEIFQQDEPILAPYIENSSFFLDESVLGVAWEPLWT